MTDADEQQFRVFLRQFAPDEELDSVAALNQGFSNRSFRIKTKRPDKTQGDYVVKRYSEHEDVTGQDRNTRGILEYELLKFLHTTEIPCPEPLYFNPNETLFDSAVLVTQALRGEQIMAHPANPLW